MKKLLFISFFSILTLNTLFSQIFYDQDVDKNLYLNFKYKNNDSRELKYLLDSAVSYNYNTPNSEWVKSSKSINLYDIKGNLISEINQKISSNVYSNSSKQNYIYNNDNLIEFIDTKFWNSNKQVWENNSLDSIFYKGKIEIKYILKNWESSLSNYVNFNKFEKEIDANDKIISYTYSYWDDIDGKWLESSYNKYNYNVAGNKYLSIDYNYDKTTQKLLQTSKDSFSYDNQNRVIEDIQYNFNDIDSSYIPYTKSISKYTKDIDSTIFYSWDTLKVDWIKKARYNYTYDSNGDLIGFADQWLIKDKWISMFEYSFKYDENHNREELIVKSSSNYVLKNLGKTTYFYTQRDIISSVQTIDPKLKIYPNPTYSVLNLENINGYEKATIYDINGKLLVQKVISNDVEKIDLSNLTNGIYFLRLVNKNTDIVTKIIKN